MLVDWEQRFGLRADGEVELPDGTGVAWRELAAERRTLLVKAPTGVTLRPLAELLQPFARGERRSAGEQLVRLPSPAQRHMGLGILCPGQGSQGSAMLELVADDEAAQLLLAEAGAAFGQGLRELVKASTEIHRNRIAQPLLCATEAATWAALKPRMPTPNVFASDSVGELAAYGCAGSLSTLLTQVISR